MCSTDLDKAFALIDELAAEGLCLGPAAEADIDRAEESLRVRLPEFYRRFLRKCGALDAGPVTIYGLGVPWDCSPSVVWARSLIVSICPHVPKTLVPIELLDDGQFVCLLCEEATPGATDAPVVIWNPDTYMHDRSLAPTGLDFATYLYKRLAKYYWFIGGLKTLEKHVKQIQERLGYDHAKGGKLPRNHEWRPYRFCVQDVLFGATVVRHYRDGNYLQVDVFLPVDIPEYEPDAGAKALTLFLLSEAYKCGGTMEIEFTKNVEGGHVPASIRRIAGRHGVKLSRKNRLLPSESRQLYAALTDFSPELRAVLDELQEAGRLSIERACYAIHHGVWSKPEAEAIILSSHYPDSVLGGEILPEQRHLYLQDLQDARAALLGGYLDWRLAMKEHQDASGVTYDLEDDVRDLKITFDPKTYAKTYVCPEDVPIPWLAGEPEKPTIVPAYTSIQVLVRARDATGLKVHMSRDILLAQQLWRDRRAKGDEGPVFILVPSDFYELGPQAEELISTARKHQIGILVCPEFMLTLAEEAARRLARSRVIRDD